MNPHKKDQLEARMTEAMDHLKYALEELKAERLENCKTFLFMVVHHAQKAREELHGEIIKKLDEKPDLF